MEDSKLTEIKQIYIQYLEEEGKIKSYQTFTDGLMGFGKKNDSFTCHDEFIQKLEVTISELASTEASQDDVFEILKFIYEQPMIHRDRKSAFFMMIAVHSLTEKLITLLLPKKAEELFSMYNGTYPKRERLPVQKKILKLLEIQCQ